MRKHKRIQASSLAGAACLAGMAYLAVPGTAAAQSLPTYTFDMPQQDLGDALRSVAKRAGWELYATARDVNGVSASALHANVTPREAIFRLLQGTGLEAQFSHGVVKIRRRLQADARPTGDGAASDIIVTGSHIRGATVIAPMVTLSQQDMEDAGQTDLGVATRALPQNFSGGQNPGIGLGSTGSNSNLNSTSSVNLRGLGPDATLTLLNGHRVPTDGAYAGVDISAIPVAAVDHLDIVMDGASALYGSDAVGGVVNVILKKDVDGVITSTRIGTSTEGGDFNQQADIVAGTHWSNGGVFATYDFAHNDAILASQRDYSSSLIGQATLYPSTRRHAVLVSGHQDLAGNVEFKIDANYDKRWSSTLSGTSGSTGLTTSTLSSVTEAFSASPEIDIKIGKAWQLKVLGSAGRDLSDYNTTSQPPTGAATSYIGCYCDTAYSTEVNADGPLFHLPGGSATIALGGGWRTNQQAYTYSVNAALTQHYDNSQSSIYGFGEISLPIVGAAQGITFIHRLVLSGAGRYEDYPGMAKLGTPKVAMLYEPDENVSFKVSWGKSFKAPTLYQKYLAYSAYLLPAAAYGVGPAGTGLLYVSGGNPNLKPETATSLTAGFAVHPVAVPGLKFEANYFDIQYHNRITEPINGTLSNALHDPGYATLFDDSPSASAISSLIAGSSIGLLNLSGAPYSPSNVLAIVDDRYRNLAYQVIRGADFDLSYRTALGGHATLNTQLSGTYLDSQQTLTATLPATQLAGIVFNPPHWRLRGGMTYRHDAYNLSAFVNYIGSVTDNRFAPAPTVPGNATLDLDAQLPLFVRADGRPGILLSLTINNVLGQRPGITRTQGPTDTPFDSTNYSPVGRMISVGLSRRW